MMSVIHCKSQCHHNINDMNNMNMRLFVNIFARILTGLDKSVEIEYVCIKNNG